MRATPVSVKIFGKNIASFYYIRLSGRYLKVLILANIK